MKWIFALNAESVEGYGDFARVAVVSALQNTSLQPVCLFDGGEGEFPDWLRNRGVEVVFARSRFHDELKQLAREKNEPIIFDGGAGAFLRLEIPRIAQEQNWPDEFVFYTDCDVMFQSDPRPLLERLRPRYFAACPETSQTRRLDLNTGAMLMNVRALGADAEFGKWTSAHLEQCVSISFDQAAYRVFYNPPHRFAWRLGVPERYFYAVMARLRLHTWKWEDLPIGLNWKPYWGPNPDACVIHFHGLKPTQRAQLAAGTLPPLIANMHTPFWDECVAHWDELLSEAYAT